MATSILIMIDMAIRDRWPVGSELCWYVVLDPSLRLSKTMRLALDSTGTLLWGIEAEGRSYIYPQTSTQLPVFFFRDKLFQRLTEFLGIERIVEDEQGVHDDLLPHEAIFEPMEGNDSVCRHDLRLRLTSEVAEHSGRGRLRRFGSLRSTSHKHFIQENEARLKGLWMGEMDRKQFRPETDSPLPSANSIRRAMLGQPLDLDKEHGSQ